MSAAPEPPPPQRARFPYKAFLSHSHAADGQLCAMLQAALQGFAKPWYRRRAIRVFRDTTGLAVTPDLWDSIRAALQASEYFILFASERAAQSRWVEMEVDAWLRMSSTQRLLIVLTDGELVWDAAAGDFDWRRTTSLPPRLRGAFRAEPLHLDLRWARTRDDLSPRRPEFLDAVARLSATLRELPLDDLVSEDVRQHRRTRALAGAAVTGLAVLLVAAVVAATLALQQRSAARAQLVQLMVANGARQIDEHDLSAAALWFAEALRLDASGPREREAQRIRLEAAVGRHPALAQTWSADAKVVGRRVAFGRDERYVLSDGFREEASPGGSSAAPGPGIWNARTGEPLTLTLPPAARRALAVDAAADRARAVVTGAEGAARIVDARSGAELARLDQPGRTLDAAFARDGRVVITAADDGAVRLWETADGRLLESLQHRGRLTGASLTPDRRRVLSLTQGGTAHVWTLGGEHAARAHLEIAHKDEVEQIGVSRDGRRAITVAGRDARLWDLATGGAPTLLQSWSAVNHAEFSPDGSLLLMADHFGEATVWSLEPLKQETAVKHDGAVLHAAFGRDGKRFATAGTDRVARIWNAQSGAPLSPPLHHEDTVTGVAFDAEHKRLATATAGGLVRVWDLDRAPPPLAHKSVDHAAFDRDGRRLLTVGAWEVKLWRLEGGAPLTLSVGSQIYHAELSPDGERIVTASEDGRARLWDAATGKELLSLRHGHRVSHASFRADGLWLATAGASRAESSVGVWDARTGDKLFTLPGGASEPWRYVAFARDGTRLLALGLGATALWDVANRSRLEGFRFEDASSAAFSPDGARLVALHGRSNARAYDAARASPVGPAIRHENYLMDRAAFGADARTLVLVGGGYARVWNAEDGMPVTPPLRHESRSLVTYAVASADGRYLATAASDGSARLWHARTGQAITPPLVHGSHLRHVAISPDGSRIATSGGDAVRVWTVAAASSGGDELLALSARVLAARRIDATGGVVPLSGAEFREAWNAFRAASGPSR